MKKRDLLIVMCLVSCAASAIADGDQEPTPGPLPRVALLEVLDEVSENTGRVFVVDKMVESGIVVGQADPKSIDYSMLLVILRRAPVVRMALDYQ